MRVYYTPTIRTQIDDAIVEAKKLDRKIDHIYLTSEEAAAFTTELRFGFGYVDLWPGSEIPYYYVKYNNTSIRWPA